MMPQMEEPVTYQALEENATKGFERALRRGFEKGVQKCF